MKIAHAVRNGVDRPLEEDCCSIGKMALEYEL
jgi:hypothetical protein